MFKEFLVKKLLQAKLSGLPKAEQERIASLVTKNPKLFEEIAKKIKAKTDAGADQMMASMTVMKEYQKELQQLMMNEGK